MDVCYTLTNDELLVLLDFEKYPEIAQETVDIFNNCFNFGWNYHNYPELDYMNEHIVNYRICSDVWAVDGFEEAVECYKRTPNDHVNSLRKHWEDVILHLNLLKTCDLNDKAHHLSKVGQSLESFLAEGRPFFANVNEKDVSFEKRRIFRDISEKVTFVEEMVNEITNYQIEISKTFDKGSYDAHLKKYNELINDYKNAGEELTLSKDLKNDLNLFKRISKDAVYLVAFFEWQSELEKEEKVSMKK